MVKPRVVRGKLRCIRLLTLVIVVLSSLVLLPANTARADDLVGIIYLGDSRFAGMQSAVSNELKPNEFFVCSVGGGSAWLSSTGVSSVDTIIREKTSFKSWVIVTNLGINDLDAGSYTSKYSTLLSGAWSKHKVYFTSVNPTYNTGRGQVPPNNGVIESFNSDLKGGVNWSGYIDTYSVCVTGNFAGKSGDGIHYGQADNRVVYGTIKSGIASVTTTMNSAVSDSGETDIPGLKKGSNWGDETPVSLPTKDSLGKDESTVSQWGKDVETKKANAILGFFRSVVAFVGILIVVYSVLLYLAYWLDRVNNLFDMRALGVLTLGKLRVSPDDKTSTFNSEAKEAKLVVHRDMLKVVFIGVFVGVMLLTGKVYWLIGKILYIIKNTITELF